MHTRLFLAYSTVLLNLLAVVVHAESAYDVPMQSAIASEESESGSWNSSVKPFAPLDSSERLGFAESIQASYLPTQNVVTEAVPETDDFMVTPMEGDSSAFSSISKGRIRQLMRPTFSFNGEWQAEASDVELFSYDANLTIPTYPFFGPPPPMVIFSFSYTDIVAPAVTQLPNDLYDYSVGLAWMRRINERWMLRIFTSVALATDNHNTSSDAWQFRGGLFAMYQPKPELTWLFGALALGRNDIPVVPAAGLIWNPHARLKFDLILPKPKIAYLLSEKEMRQSWAFLGMGLNGGTWGYERSQGIDDQLTYRDWRVVLGWESIPAPEPGMPFARGRKFGIEVGYAFGRKFEFKSNLPDFDLDNTLMLRTMLSF